MVRLEACVNEQFSDLPAEAFRRLVELAVDPMTLIDPSGTVLYQNPASQIYFGWSPEELVSQNIFDFMHPDDVDVAAGAALRIWQGDDVDRIIVRFKTKSREWRLVEVVASVGWEGNLFLNTRDVTDREAMVSQITQSNERFSTAFNASSKLAIIADVSSGRALIVDANEAFAEFVGESQERCKGKTVAELGAVADDLARDHLFERLNADGVVRQHRLMLKNSLGEDRVFLVDVEIIGRESELFHFNAIDITDREAVENQLYHAKHMEAVGQLSGGVAHDFNNMLTVVTGHVDLIRSNINQKAEVYSSLDVIQNVVERGASLIEKLLTFSRKIHLQPKAVSISDSVDMLLELVRPTLTESIEVTLSGRSDWLCYLDPGLFENSLMNLVLNAKDAMPGGGSLNIDLRDTTLTQDDSLKLGLLEGDYVGIKVTDMGHGMAEETIERVFEPFFTTRSEIGGTGLGLSMVYGFVSQSGGHISVESRQGKGTTFSLLLPRAVR